MSEVDWLPQLLSALGWQGGTIHQALEEVARLRAEVAKIPGLTRCLNESLDQVEDLRDALYSSQVALARLQCESGYFSPSEAFHALEAAGAIGKRAEGEKP